jgi:hypothetical protein
MRWRSIRFPLRFATRPHVSEARGVALGDTSRPRGVADLSGLRVAGHRCMREAVAHHNGTSAGLTQMNRRCSQPSLNGTFINGCERFSEKSQSPSIRR